MSARLDPSAAQVGFSPRIGGWVPGLAIRGLFALVAITLCVTMFSYGLWITLGAMLTAAAVARPRLLAPWAVILLLGGSILWRAPSAVDWHFFVLLAGLHLLHVLGSQMLVLPWNGRVQLRGIGGVLLRFLAIQVPCQLVSWGALLLFAPHGLAPSDPTWIRIVVGIVGALALVALAVVLIRPLVTRPATDRDVR